MSKLGVEKTTKSSFSKLPIDDTIAVEGEKELEQDQGLSDNWIPNSAYNLAH